VPTLKLRFPGGRYHATPWGHHVNEGLIEWPPSPWRLLRALIACGFSSQGWMEVPTIAQQLIYKLASVLPSYRLPEATAAHTRHFMPLGSLEKGREKTTLVFDTFAHVGDRELLVHWPCELGKDENTLLGELAWSLGYLGRSESWVAAELIPDGPAQITGFNALPHREGMRPGRDYEQLSLMAPIVPADYTAWHQEVTTAALKELPLPGGKKKPTAKLLKDRERAVAPYPPALLSCLTKDTAWWKGHGWSQPPGSQRVLYWRRADALQVGAPSPMTRRPTSPISAVLLALTTPSGNKSALPHISRTLPQAELMHAALVGRAGNGHRVNCPELTGQDDRGKPLRNGHRHAHILPLDLDNDNHIDHILIYASMGLGDAAQHAIRALKRTWTKGGVAQLQLAIVGKGSLDDLRRLSAPLNAAVARLLGPNQAATCWVSVTPFVPPRFVKRPGKKNDVAHQVNAELRSRGLPEAEVSVLPWNLRETIPLRHYIRRRRRSEPPPQDTGYPIGLKFAQAVRGPIALGYGSHFGLGLFHAVDVE
jgi:CRISPR-associated protein Csb2